MTRDVFAGDPAETDNEAKDKIVDIYDVLYFGDTPLSEIQDIEARIKKAYPDVTIENASDGIHGERRAFRINKTSDITYLKNLFFWDCEGRSLHFQHAMRAGSPWVDRVMQALQLARSERPDMFDKER
jgi:hypothetical protein